MSVLLWIVVAASEAAPRPAMAHVIVALADNAHQGIVPVPKAIGNGQDAANNLYWGARYGVKHYLSHDAGWRAVPHTSALPEGVLERVVFRVSGGRGYVVADAYDGRFIQRAIQQTLAYLAGQGSEQVPLASGGSIEAGAAARLIAFVGHDGLMDFSLPRPPERRLDQTPRAAVVLACSSKAYFGPLLARLEAEPVLLTTGLMAPEAYVLHAALEAFFAGKSRAAVRNAAAVAYHRYQKCGLSAARRLFDG